MGVVTNLRRSACGHALVTWMPGAPASWRRAAMTGHPVRQSGSGSAFTRATSSRREYEKASPRFAIGGRPGSQIPDGRPDMEARRIPDNPASQGALEGIRVLDLTSVVMGPYGTQILGDLGADVIKVETEQGDTNRIMGGGPHPELSGVALNINRNKRAVSLDLKASAGREAFLRILDTCDVLVTNLRPGPLGRLGLAYQDVGLTRPGLVYCQAQGFRSGTAEENRPA